MDSTVASLIDLLSKGGALAASLLFLWLLLTERVVPVGRLNDQKSSTKDALDIARAANQAVERISDAVEARNKLELQRSQVDAEITRRENETQRRGKPNENL